MATVSLEERLSAGENEVGQIKRHMEGANAPADVQWWRGWLGAFNDDPYFESAMARGEAYRRTQPTPADSGGDGFEDSGNCARP